MRFGVFHELQLPRPWDDGAEHRRFHDALAQVELADRLGIDSASRRALLDAVPQRAPKPLQTPHPPMWMACINRDTIRVAASRGIGALAFSFVDPEEARNWSRIYYDTNKSDACVPLGPSVNANIAMMQSVGRVTSALV